MARCEALTQRLQRELVAARACSELLTHELTFRRHVLGRTTGRLVLLLD